ncbi:MAG TPA: NAD(P)/FAD-dependent oxidoreductase [Baekduia sp.]|nr:NAD(P)/FAD-dependent oxidoreductase [Baekduia sp.]
MPDISPLPRKSSVIVVGGGLSGLVAARDLIRAGVQDVVIVEAQDEIGGRIKSFTRPNGGTLEQGAEFTGTSQPTMLALLAELGIETQPMTAGVDPAAPGLFVRISNGQRHLEPYPLADDPEALSDLTAGLAAFGEMVGDISTDAPWEDPRALELDRRTVGMWVDETVSNPAANRALKDLLQFFGPTYETSLLLALAYLERFGGIEHLGEGIESKLVGGTSGLVAKLAAEIGDRIYLSAPVRKIVNGSDAVSVETDRGTIDGDLVIVAMDPSLITAIEFEPTLPNDRAKLQIRWGGNAGAKVCAIYDTPFWREDGLAGFAIGEKFLQMAIDVSPAERSEGVLTGMVFAYEEHSGKTARILEDPELTRKTALAELESYYGPKAANPIELYVFDWTGKRWSHSAGGTTLSPGVLTTCGPALRRPVGRVLWAGEAVGSGIFMEGAASAGKAAAAAAVARLNGEVTPA